MVKTKGLLIAAVLLGSVATGAPASAGEVPVFQLAGNYAVNGVTSLKERKYQRIIRQKYDFSCGSAAVATLLTHHYGLKRNETDVFQEMWGTGDAEKIRKEGFSMLDMQRYLAHQGLRANGFRAPLDKLREAGVPAIVLINTKGYRHFVVVKGISDSKVLVADPALGTRVMKRDDFEAAWNGVAFVVLDVINRGRDGFNRDNDWAVQPKAPIDALNGWSSLSAFMLALPGRNFF